MRTYYSHRLFKTRGAWKLFQPSLDYAALISATFDAHTAYAHNIFICSDCKYSADKKTSECPQCGKICEKPIKRFRDEKHYRKYVLGYQETVEEKNRQVLMKIDEHGVFTLERQ